MTHLSTFSGIGGIDLSAHWAGFTTVAFCEIDPYCQRVLARHWPGVPIYDDIRTLTAESLHKRGIGRIDLLSGGFPCQPFSLAGKRKGREDERFLFPELLRVIREVRPLWLLLENVPGLLSIAIDEVVQSLEAAGYRVFPPLVFEASDVGAPHGRERVFIVAHSQGAGQSRRERKERSGWPFADGCGAGVGQADPESQRVEGNGTAREQEQRVPAGEGLSGRDGAGRGTQTLGDAAGGVRCGTASNAGFPVAADEDRGLSGGSVEPRLGGDADGLPGRMDPMRWPAPLGPDQYEWEPPRLCGRIPNRAARLKALGNAVCPAQVYPVLAGIAACLEESR